MKLPAMSQHMAVPETHALHAISSDNKTSIEHIETRKLDVMTPNEAEEQQSGLEYDPNNPMVSLSFQITPVLLL